METTSLYCFTLPNKREREREGERERKRGREREIVCVYAF